MDHASDDPRAAIGSDKSIPCGIVQDLLPAAVGGELEPATEAALERHLSECLQCGREWVRLRDSHEALRALRPGSSGDFDDEFFADLHAGIVGEIRRQGRMAADAEALAAAGDRPRSAWATALPMLVALAAMLVAGFFIGQGSQRSAPTPAPVTGLQAAASHDTILKILASPEFTPFLLNAMRDFASNSASSHVLDSKTGLTIPESATVRALAPTEADF